MQLFRLSVNDPHCEDDRLFPSSVCLLFVMLLTTDVRWWQSNGPVSKCLDEKRRIFVFRFGRNRCFHHSLKYRYLLFEVPVRVNRSV